MKPLSPSEAHWRQVHLTGDRSPPFTRSVEPRRPFWKPDFELKLLAERRARSARAAAA